MAVRFLDSVQSSGTGASGLHSSENSNRPVGSVSGDLLLMDSFGSAKGEGKGPPAPSGGGTTETVTDVYVTGLDDGIDDSLQYNIEIRFVGDWTDEMKAVFIASADYLASLIAEDVPDAVDGSGNLYDDLVITADLDAIDGVGGILGQAGPTGVRTGSGIPAIGEMTFDEADAQAYYDAGAFDDIILHEMMHVVGFGTMWEYNGLVTTQVDDNGTKKPTDDIITSVYSGEAATSAYVSENPDEAFLFVETDGGSGTAGGHWDEETYFDELMTGYIGYRADDGSYDSTNFLSDWSVAALTDLGYVLVDGASGIADDVVLV